MGISYLALNSWADAITYWHYGACQLQQAPRSAYFHDITFSKDKESADTIQYMDLHILPPTYNGGWAYQKIFDRIGSECFTFNTDTLPNVAFDRYGACLYGKLLYNACIHYNPV